MSINKILWNHIRVILEQHEARQSDTINFLKAFMFGIAYLAENANIPPAMIAKLQDEVRNDVRLARDLTPLGGDIAEA